MNWPVSSFLILVIAISCDAQEHGGFSRIELLSVPENAISTPGASGVGFKGRTYERVNSSLLFIGPDGNEIVRLSLASKTTSGPDPDTIAKISFRHQISKDLQFAGVIESEYIYPRSGDYEGPLYYRLTFRYYNSLGHLLWEKPIVCDTAGNEFSLSEDGHRIALITGTPETPREFALRRDEGLGLRKNWISVFDLAGSEVAHYEPESGDSITAVSISNKGKYLIANATCVSLLTGKKYRPTGPGFVSIDDGGICRSNRYLRKHDSVGKQLTETTDEFIFK